jgi:hypothetical protein
MGKVKDGGPAFPNSAENPRAVFSGMTLRDYFAGQALSAIFGGTGARDVAARDGRYDETNWADVVAANCYEMADAMLAARTPHAR